MSMRFPNPDFGFVSFNIGATKSRQIILQFASPGFAVIET
jgi:hypothetical protein